MQLDRPLDRWKVAPVGSVVRAAILESQPGSLVIGEVAIDKPAPGEVLVRTVAAGLCHSDLHFMENLYPHPCPVVLGHESAGVVEAVGEGVTAVRPVITSSPASRRTAGPARTA